MADRSPELNELEQQLKKLTPRAAALDRDRIMYEAGAAASRRVTGAPARIAYWRAAAALLLIGTIVQSIRLQLIEPQIVERIVYHDRSEANPQPPGSAPPAIEPSASATELATSMPVVRPSLATFIFERNRMLQSPLEMVAIPERSGRASTTVQTFGELRQDLLQAATGRLTPTGNQQDTSQEL